MNKSHEKKFKTYFPDPPTAAQNISCQTNLSFPNTLVCRWDPSLQETHLATRYSLHTEIGWIIRRGKKRLKQNTDQPSHQSVATVPFQGFRPEPLLRAAARSPPLQHSPFRLCLFLWDENICEGSKWTGRSNLRGSRFGAHQCRWATQSSAPKRSIAAFKASICHVLGILWTLKQYSRMNVIYRRRVGVSS